MNGSPTPPTYGFCVPPPGRLVFLLANKVKPVFIFFQTLDIAYTAHWIGFIIQFLLLFIASGTRWNQVHVKVKVERER